MSTPTPHIWKRHELESYLLVAQALARVSGIPEDRAEELLDEALETTKPEAQAGLYGSRAGPLRHQGLSDKTIAEKCQAELDERWRTFSTRLALCPGKEALAALNRLLPAEGLKAISASRMAASLHQDEVADEVQSVLEDIQSLIRGRG